MCTQNQKEPQDNTVFFQIYDCIKLLQNVKSKLKVTTNVLF